jgi:hypothetical protein
VLLLAGNPITFGTLRLLRGFSDLSKQDSVSFLLICDAYATHTNTTLEILDVSEIADLPSDEVADFANHCPNLHLLV